MAVTGVCTYAQISLTRALETPPLTQAEISVLKSQGRLFTLSQGINLYPWRDLSNVFVIRAFQGPGLEQILLPGDWSLIQRPPIDACQDNENDKIFFSIRDSENHPRGLTTIDYRIYSTPDPDILLYSKEESLAVFAKEQAYALLKKEQVNKVKECSIVEIQSFRSDTWSTSHPFGVFLNKDMSRYREGGYEQEFPPYHHICLGFCPTLGSAEQLQDFALRYSCTEAEKDEVFIAQLDTVLKNRRLATAKHPDTTLSHFRMIDDFTMGSIFRFRDYWENHWPTVIPSLLPREVFLEKQKKENVAYYNKLRQGISFIGSAASRNAEITRLYKAFKANQPSYDTYLKEFRKLYPVDLSIVHDEPIELLRSKP
jgi:hypothetical protein